MSTNLTGLKVKDTYNSLLKIGDNSSLAGTPDQISDGFGNTSPLYLTTSQVSIGVIPATGYDLTVNSGTKTGSLFVVGAASAASLQLTGGTGTQGTMSWNTDEETVDIIQNGATLQVGQEVQVHVKNQTGSTINDGTPVYVTGTLGASGRLTVAPMIADGSIEAKYFLGVTTEDIPNGEDGKVTTFGKIRGLDTTAYTEGQTLYVSSTTAGFWQTTPPVAPALDLEVAIVINVSANNGTIFVRAQNGYYLGMLHDVYLNSPANNQFLVYNSTNSRWENQGIASVSSINLDSVTDNGNTTTNSITVGNISAGDLTLSGVIKAPATFTIDPSPYGTDEGILLLQGQLKTNSIISDDVLDIDAVTQINLKANGSTKARVTTSGFEIIGGIDFTGVDGISLTDTNSTTDSYFHANIDYDAGLYQVISNTRYGADYIQVDGLDTRGNTVFAISPKSTTTSSPDLFLGGNYSVTAPNTLTNWRFIDMNVSNGVRINGQEVATRTWVSSQGYLTSYTETDTLQSVTDRGATTTNSITTSGKIIVARGTTAVQSVHDLYIGGSGLAGSDSSIYIGNGGDGTGYGWQIYYAGTGNGNDNRLQIKSENLGSSATAIDMLQDGTVLIPNSLGVGANSPESLLHVSSGTSGDAIVIIEADTDNNTEGDIPQIWFRADGGINESAIINNDNVLELVNNVSSGGGIAFSTGSTNNYNLTSPTTGASIRMFITSAGNVGIGTSSPSVKLHANSGTDNGVAIFESTDSAAYIDIKDNTGYGRIVSGNSGDMWFSPNGTEAMRIDSSGVVQVRNITPTIQLYNTDDSLASNQTLGDIDWYQIDHSDQGVGTVAKIRAVNISSFSGAADLTFHTGNATTLSERMRIDSSGRVGIGTTSPSKKLDVNGTTIFRGTSEVINSMGTAGNFSACQLRVETTNVVDTTGWQGISFDTSTSANYGWSIGANRSGSGRGSFRVYEHAGTDAGTERFTLQQDGNVGIGDSTPSYKLDVNGTIRATGDVIAYSDARVKENVKTIDNAIDKVTQLRGVSYNKIGETEEKIGVIAQEIEKVLPQVVQEDAEGMKSVAYGNIVGVLIEAIKEQQKQIEELKAKINGITN